MSNDLVKQDGKVPVEKNDVFEEASSVGHSDVTGISELSIPYVQIGQALTPCVKDRESPVNLGDLFFHNTAELIPTPVRVIPLGMKHQICIWRDRANGGGLVEIHSYASYEENFNKLLKNDKGVKITPEGHTAIDTYQNYVMILDRNGSHKFAIMSIGGNGHIGEAKIWNTHRNDQMRETDVGTRTAGWVEQIYSVGTFTKVNKQGQDWEGWEIKFDRLLEDNEEDKNLFVAAMTYRQNIDSGLFDADAEASYANTVDVM